MTSEDFRVLAQFAAKYDDSVVDELGKVLSANYANFNPEKFQAYVDKIRRVKNV